MNFGTLVTGASALLVVLVFLSLRRSSARKAPVVHYWIPWIGSAFDIGRDPDGFFHRAIEKYGPIFTVNAFGRTVTYVTTPSLIGEVFRNPQKFCYLNIRMDIGVNMFKMDYNFSFSPFMKDKVFPAHHRYMSQQKIKPLLKNYAEHAFEAVMEARGKFDGACTPLIPFLIPPAYKSAAYAFFGRSFPAEETYEPFKSFDSIFSLKFAGVPEFFLKKNIQDWYRVHKMIEDYLTTPHDESSEIVHFLEQEAKAEGFTNRDVAAFLSLDLWALEANATYAAYWTIVLQMQRPEGLAPLIKEVDEARASWTANHPNAKFRENICEFSLEASLPLLISTIRETLRYSTSVMPVREVEEPLELAGYQFDKGEQILCATRCIHLDGEIHKDADKFIPDRYMTTKKFMKNGKPVQNHSLPFGGGDSQCEGRHFALGQLKIIVLLLLSYTTLEIDPQSDERPSFNMQRLGIGVLQPKGDLGIIIRKRN